MFVSLYPITYIISLTSLIAWFYCQDSRQWSRLIGKVFLGGFLSYLLSLFMVEGATNHKLFVLCRDLVVMGVVAQFFSFFRKSSLLFFALLAGFYGLFAVKGAHLLEQTFSAAEQSITSNIELSEEGELLVEMKGAYDIGDIQEILEAYTISAERAFFPASPITTELDEYYVLDIPSKQLKHLSTIEKEIAASKYVEWVEPNEVIKLSPIETKMAATTKKQFGTNDPDLEQLWGFEAMNVDALYKGLSKSKIKPRAKALIAILDTGVDATHEDLAANFISIDPKSNKDTRGHGTHCAGVAAAVSNNKIGIASFAPSNQFVQVTSVRVLTGFGMGTQKGIIDGMILAADKGADVISMSLGGMSNALKQQAYEKAVKYCNDKGAIVVVAAGNSNKDALNYTPANLSNVITVSAIDPDLNRATFSNYITNLNMGIAAPGVGIYSTIPGNKYATFNGTSMATPYVSGLVGVLKSIQPDLTTKEVYKILKETGMDTKATKETGRLIQPAKALEMVID